MEIFEIGMLIFIVVGLLIGFIILFVSTKMDNGNNVINNSSNVKVGFNSGTVVSGDLTINSSNNSNCRVNFNGNNITNYANTRSGRGNITINYKLESIEEIKELNHPFESEIIKDFNNGVLLFCDGSNNVNCKSMNNSNYCYNSTNLNNCDSCIGCNHCNNCDNCENVEHMNNQEFVVKKHILKF